MILIKEEEIKELFKQQPRKLEYLRGIITDLLILSSRIIL